MDNRIIIRFLLPALLLIIASSSCDRDSVIIEGGEEITTDTLSEVTFWASDIITKVSGTQFEMSDVINVEAYTSLGELYGKELYLYDISAIFTSSSPFMMDGQTALSYTALYPANATSRNFADDFIFNIETNQSTLASYEQSDMLVAKVASTSLLMPELSFYHTMSTIAVSVVGVSSTSEISAKLYAQSAVECNIEAGTYQGSGSTNAILPYITSSGFEALVAPQQLAAGTIVIMTIGEHEYIWENNMSSTLLSGYKYNYIWSIDESSGESSVTFDGMINDWASGEWTPGDIITGETETESDTSKVLNGEIFDSVGENLQGEFEINGVTFEYAGINITEVNESRYIEISDSGYILNTSALYNLSEVVVDDNSGDIENLVLSGGTTFDQLTVLKSLIESTYKIPHNSVYIKLSASDESGSFKFKEIEFKQEYTDEV